MWFVACMFGVEDTEGGGLQKLAKKDKGDFLMISFLLSFSCFVLYLNNVYTGKCVC
ncbi:hypothetical protein BDZ91DRAFT_720544 [Kalaharituber pfeilii]|nr:hypothetical protein BDZ91DRAFT_720544 [Kalaharituber pfeilii]